MLAAILAACAEVPTSVDLDVAPSRPRTTLSAAAAASDVAALRAATARRLGRPELRPGVFYWNRRLLAAAPAGEFGAAAQAKSRLAATSAGVPTEGSFASAGTLSAGGFTGGAGAAGALASSDGSALSASSTLPGTTIAWYGRSYIFKIERLDYGERNFLSDSETSAPITYISVLGDTWQERDLVASLFDDAANARYAGVTWGWCCQGSGSIYYRFRQLGQHYYRNERPEYPNGRVEGSANSQWWSV